MFEKLRKIVSDFKALESKVSDPDFIKDQAAYQKALKEMGGLAKIAEAYQAYETLMGKHTEIETMLEDEEDPDLLAMAEEESEELKKSMDKALLDIKRLLVQDDTHMGKNLIVEIRAGTGGDEASLFSGDLFRIYQHFAENNGLKIEVLSASHSEVGGFKELVFSLAGKRAWELFRFESGGHRVQRVPSTESQGRIHTSAATVAVLPEAGEVEVDVKESDLKIDTYRAGGPGGQNVNKVSSAIRITHLPTGVVVQCQDESSQHKNRSKAMRILTARLYDREQNRIQSERAKERRGQIGSGDRNMRVRTYNFPQNRVTDHRSKINYSLEIVLGGGLEKVVADLTEWDMAERLKNFSL